MNLLQPLTYVYEVTKTAINKLFTIVLALLFASTGIAIPTGVYAQAFIQPPDAFETLTLAQAVELALTKNPATRITAAGRKMADAQLREARTGRMPVLQASEIFTTSNNPVFVFGSLLEQGRFAPKNFDIDSLNQPNSLANFRSAVTLRLPLFDQRKTETNVSQAKIKITQADQQSELVAQQIRFEVIRSYFGLLLAQASEQVAEDAVKTAEADVKRARDLFETGIVVQSDLLAAEVQLSEFRQQRVQATAELNTARAALNTALGVPINSSQQLSGQLVARSFSIESTSELAEQALQNRPDYQRAISKFQASKVDTRGARGEWYPRVDAFATAGASSQYLVGGSGDYAVGASVTFNVFDAGRKERIDKAQAAEAIASAEQEQLANQIRFEVVNAYEQYLSARERLLVVTRAIDQARETLRIVQDRYNSGLTPITELLRAEIALVRAQNDELVVRYDHYVGYARVLLAAGRLKDVSPFVS